MTVVTHRSAILNRCTYSVHSRFSLVLHALLLLYLFFDFALTFSFLLSVRNNANLTLMCKPQRYLRYTATIITIERNMRFFYHSCLTTLTLLWIIWILTFLSGDVHPNPGPIDSNNSLDYSFSSNSSSISSQELVPDITTSLDISHHLSFVHYNVQSLYPKLDILRTELRDFDILAFSETWLGNEYKTDDLLFHNFKSPERKDRSGDRHGGVILYVRDTLFHKRRPDLELANIESIWIEVVSNKKHFLFGVYYRPPNANALYSNIIEDSIHMAIDTGLSDIIIVGDFNYNTLNSQSNRKVLSICTQFALTQCISSATHFTEHSESIIDLLLVSNKESIVTCGVGDPFLQQEIRFHCPIYGLLKFSKQRIKPFKRRIWQYELGDYNMLRREISSLNWDDLKAENFEEYTNNIVNTIISLSKEYIPNKEILVRQSDLP